MFLKSIFTGCFLLLIIGGAFAEVKVSPELLALELETNFWNDVKNQNVKAYSNKLAKAFQGLNINGYYNRDEQINGLQTVKIKKFKIKQLIAKEYHDNTLVVSYTIIAKGHNFTNSFSIDVWSKVGGEWKMVSEAYVPIDESSSQ